MKPTQVVLVGLFVGLIVSCASTRPTIDEPRVSFQMELEPDGSNLFNGQLMIFWMDRAQSLGKDKEGVLDYLDFQLSLELGGLKEQFDKLPWRSKVKLLEAWHRAVGNTNTTLQLINNQQVETANLDPNHTWSYVARAIGSMKEVYRWMLKNTVRSIEPDGSEQLKFIKNYLSRTLVTAKAREYFAIQYRVPLAMLAGSSKETSVSSSIKQTSFEYKSQLNDILETEYKFLEARFIKRAYDRAIRDGEALSTEERIKLWVWLLNFQVNP